MCHTQSLVYRFLAVSWNAADGFGKVNFEANVIRHKVRYSVELISNVVLGRQRPLGRFTYYQDVQGRSGQ